MSQTAVLDPNVSSRIGEAVGPGIYQPITFSDTDDLPVAVRTVVAGADGLLRWLRWNQSAGKADDSADVCELNVTAGQKLDVGYVRRFLSTGTAAALKAAGGLAGAS